MPTPTETSARQIVSRDVLQQIFPTVAGQQLDLLLRSINIDLSVPLRADASSAPDLVVTFGPSNVNNTVSGRQKSISHINNLIPVFTSGTITFPSSDGGTITVSPGSNITLNCPSNQFNKILVSLNSTGNLVASQGTPNAVVTSVAVPVPITNTTPICFIVIFNSSGTIQNIVQNQIFQFSGGSSSGGGSGFTMAVQDHTTPVATDPTFLNFTGPGVSAAASGGGADITIGSSKRLINAQVGSSYTLALADGYSSKNFPLVTMNNAGTPTITVPPNSSVAFPIGEQVDFAGIGAGLVAVQPGVGVTIDSVRGFRMLAHQYGEGSLKKIGTNEWLLSSNDFSTFVIATGGTVTTDGDFKVHTFNSSGSFVVTNPGSVEHLVIGGGGGGGANRGGGGGAGGYLSGSANTTIGTYPITVGAGGPGSAGVAPGSNGSDSIFDTFTAIGGGGGGSNTQNGSSGGSGGGGASTSAGTGTGGAGTVGQGNVGGNGLFIVANSANSGGGGGSGSVGANGTAGTGGAGGAGTTSSITGSPVARAGGGGGETTGATQGLGQAGGGNGAFNDTGNGANATTNTGSGGGGGGSSFLGGDGASGVVIFRYRFQ